MDAVLVEPSTNLVIDRWMNVSNRLALSVEHPLNEHEHQKATSQKTNRSQDHQSHSTPPREAKAKIAPQE